MLTVTKNLKITYLKLVFLLCPIISCSSQNSYPGRPPYMDNMSYPQPAKSYNDPYGSSGGAPYQQTPSSPYGQQPAYHGYYPPQQQHQHPAPSSRNYNNPYSTPPQNNYPYYDGDQYYVPPTYYGTPDNSNSPYPDSISRF